MNFLPKRGAIGGALTALALALILSFKTPSTTGLVAGGQPQQPVGPAGTGQGGITAGQSQQVAGSGSGSGPGASPASGSGTGQKSAFSGQLTGTAVQIPFGTVQVQVTMQNGKITDVVALQLPSDQRRSQQIGQYAAPQLRSEVLAAQNAQVNTISGATYTSLGYLQSLQSALDQAAA
jgi:uncharacterized protein with FMN-binding domain